MHDFWQIFIGTFALRPYVFAFFAAFLLAAVTHLGWKKTLIFTVCGYLISFLSEFSSINTGIPYGWYYYIDTTSSNELWVAGVPFFDSLSYVFLAYCSYAMALLVVSPIRTRKDDLILLETQKIRRSVSVLFLASLFQVFLDIIIDPVALQGSRWFLGQIYGYRENGVHFGVPLSNYLGWWFVSGIMILTLQVIDRLADEKGRRPAGVTNIPFRSLLGPALYVSVITFNLSMTLLIGERLIALTGTFIYILPTAIVLVGIFRRINNYSRNEMAEHLRDYPWSAAGDA